jgi:ribonuclease BN (tRNA processing enzyme)
MNIRFLGVHNSESQASRCVCILVDGTLVMDAGGLTSTLTIKEQRKIKALLVSHHHFDHIRDIPLLALNLFEQKSSFDIYASKEVNRTIQNRLLDGKLYPDFRHLPELKPTVRFNSIVPNRSRRIDGHVVTAVPVHHNGGASYGYQIASLDDKTIFYTSDTGPGLAECWNNVSPQLLIIDVTFANKRRKFAMECGHLTPALLHKELSTFKAMKGYLPPVIAFHMDPKSEPTIKDEVGKVAESLGASITLATEGMEINI